MSMFPGPHAQVYYNEAGEPLGWDYPSEPDYCADCGGMHSTFSCPWDPYAEPDEDQEEVTDHSEEFFEEDETEYEQHAHEGY